MRGATLIVLAWNQWKLTQRCLDSLFACALDEAEVIVVDNGSTDATPHAIGDYLDRVRYLRLPENLGFVRGMNAGIAAASADNDIVLLNNDLEFSQHDWLGRMRDAAYAASDHGIVGCRLLGPAPDNLVFHVGGFIEPEGLWGQQTESGRQERDVEQYPRMRRVQGIAFALAYLRRDCIARIGVLDEAFHSYFEDTDYCLRAAEAGIAIVVAGAVTVRHHQHGSTRDDGGFRERLRTQSRATFAARWQQRLLARYRATVMWQGHTRLPHAWASLTRGLLGRLDARGLRMAFSPAQREPLADDDFRVELAAHRSLQTVPEVALLATPLIDTVTANGRFRAALVFTEWDRLPDSSAAQYNALDLVIVPDPFQAGVMRESGVTTQIEIVPFGIDREYCHYGVRAPRQPDGRMVFLCVAEDLDRDAPALVVRAFCAAFDAGQAVELIVHIAPGDDEEAIRVALQSAITDDGARVSVLFGWGFPAAERAQLYAAADALVSARHGGGWDHVAREALACGLVLIAPAWGSQQTLVERWGHALDPGMRCVDPRHPERHWRDVDPLSLQRAMSEVFSRRLELTARARERADAFAASHHLDSSADTIVDLLAQRAALPLAAIRPPAHHPLDLGLQASAQIVVLGMHRSGTSSIGGLLALFGAWPGPDAMLLRGDDNPKGHFEHGELHMACLRRLAAAAGDWQHPPKTAPSEAIDAFRREVASVLETLEAQRPWFIKEPRLCLLARELLPLLTHPVFVHVVRDPLAIADSLARRDGMDGAAALALWERYTTDAFAASSGWPRVLVDYDELIGAPVVTAHRLFADLVAAGVTGLTMPSADAIEQWVEPGKGRRAALTPSQQALRDALMDRSILSTTTTVAAR